MSSDSKEYYLKEEVYFEPLFNKWYAWPYLLAPVQAARHTVNTHKRMMKSFVNNYQLHIMASQEPGLAGADFLSCSEEQVEDIKRLLEFTENECADLIELSDAVKQLDELLRSHTSGESIEYLYSQIPGPLQGYVELCLDMEHNPSYRLIEGLLYKSKYYREQLQTVSFGFVTKDKARPFVFSTPRLADKDHIHLDLNFNSPVLDKLLQSRETPLSESELAEISTKYSTDGGIGFEDLFTTEKTKFPYKPVKSGLRAQYTGHAGFLIESPNVSILIDPVIAAREETYAGDVFGFSELPPLIDYILLTHSHQDHVNIETLLQLRYKTKTVLVPKNNGGTIADPSLKLMLQKLGFNVFEVEDMEEIQVREGKIVAIPFLGEHGDLNIRSKTAWYLEISGKKLFLGADSSNLDPNMYRHIKEYTGDIDLLAIGMECVGAPYTWMYGALHTKKVTKKIKDSRRLNGCDSTLASGMVDLFNPNQVYIYALGLETWFNYFMGLEYDENSTQIIESDRMLKICGESDVSCEKLFARKEIVFDG